MLTVIKEIFTWWNRQTLGTRLTIFFLEILLEKIVMEINIIKQKKEKDL